MGQTKRPGIIYYKPPATWSVTDFRTRMILSEKKRRAALKLFHGTERRRADARAVIIGELYPDRPPTTQERLTLAAALGISPATLDQDISELYRDNCPTCGRPYSDPIGQIRRHIDDLEQLQRDGENRPAPPVKRSKPRK